MIKIIAFLILIYTGLGFILAEIYLDSGFSISLLIGGLLMLVNLLGLAFIWRLIFSKKSIALAVVVIIFKYVILGTVLWSFASHKWLKPLGLVVGLGSLIFAILLATIIKSFTKTDLQ
jgi:hypothetical protein